MISFALLSENGSRLYSYQATVVYKLLRVHKLTTSAHYPSGNRGIERVNHTIAQMFAAICNERQNDWDVHFSMSNMLVITL